MNISLISPKSKIKYVKPDFETMDSGKTLIFFGQSTDFNGCWTRRIRKIICFVSLVRVEFSVRKRRRWKYSSMK